MRLPADFTEFLGNGQNNEMFPNLLQQSIEESIPLLGGKKIYSNKSQRTMIIEQQVEVMPELQISFFQKVKLRVRGCWKGGENSLELLES